VLVSYPRDSDVIAIDPRSGRVLGRRGLEGLVSHAVPTVRGLTLLTAPRKGLGPARIVLVDAALRVSTRTLDRVMIGSGVTENDDGELIAGRSNYAGFALRSGASRGLGYVLAAGAPPALVDLSSLSVEYPATRALSATVKSTEGSWRFAHWVGADTVVYGGVDYSASDKPNDVPLQLLDTRTWEGRVLDATASAAVVGSGLVLALDSRPSVARALGVRAYALDGRLRFAAFRTLAVGDVQISGMRALATLFGRRPVGKVLDLRTGALVTTIRGNVPHLLVGRAAAW
jgi:hypothetical protein